METVPPFEVFFRPLLSPAAMEAVSVRKSADDIANELSLSTKAHPEMTKGGDA